MVKRVAEPTSALIKIRPSTKRRMDSIKVHPREIDILEGLLAVCQGSSLSLTMIPDQNLAFC